MDTDTKLPRYIKAVGIYYVNELKHIKRIGHSPMVPIFEAFINSWEAIAKEDIQKGTIEVELYSTNNSLGLAQPNEEETDKLLDFEKIIVRDNGSGLNDASFHRIMNLRDDSKNMSNFGTGRVQFLHRFGQTSITSRYKEEGINRKRTVVLSKSEEFLKHNAIVKLVEDEKDENFDRQETTLTFTEPIEEADAKYYAQLSAAKIKEKLTNYFFPLLSENRDKLPCIIIRKYINGTNPEIETIEAAGIKQVDKTEVVKVNYRRKDQSNNLTTTDKYAEFKIKSYIFTSKETTEHRAILASKGMVAKRLQLTCIGGKLPINNKFYQFFISSNYIDTNDSDTRGELRIFNKKEAAAARVSELIENDFIVLDDIAEQVSAKVISLYSDIKNNNNEKYKRIKFLKDTFLIDNESIASIADKISADDDDEKILSSVYKVIMKNNVRNDAKIKKHLDELNGLNPTDSDYHEKMSSLATEIVAATPIQSRNELSRYIAYRKLVLEMFRKVLDGELDEYQKTGKVNEDILHDLIFRKHSDNQMASDLWVLNEEYIYFSGTSDIPLKDIVYNGEKLLDERYLKNEAAIAIAGGRNLSLKRPDILLMPEEGKCVIIEFKAPDVDVSQHLTQISTYAAILREGARDGIDLKRFYGYLIGEDIVNRDVIHADSDFEKSEAMDYLFRPSKKVSTEGRYENQPGSLYTEVIKYSSLLKRAQMRNQIFIKKLGLADELISSTVSREKVDAVPVTCESSSASDDTTQQLPESR